MKHMTLTSLWLTIPISILLLIAASGGLLIQGLYRDVPDMVAQARGQDTVTLFLVLPILIVSALIARGGSLRACFIWLGALAYLTYTYISYAFAIRYNPLFLVYITLLGCSLYALIAGLATLDMAGVKSRYTEKIPVRAVSIYLLVLAALFSFLWLSELIPALFSGAIPQSILEDGTPTNAVYVLDLAWILPAFVITSISLWKKQALGYSLAGIMLTLFVLLDTAILAMAIFQIQAGNPDAVPMSALFGMLIASAIGMLTWYLTGLRMPKGLKYQAGANAS